MLGIEAMTSLLQRRDATAVERLYAPDYIQHNPGIPQGRDALREPNPAAVHNTTGRGWSVGRLSARPVADPPRALRPTCRPRHPHGDIALIAFQKSIEREHAALDPEEIDHQLGASSQPRMATRSPSATIRPGS